MRIFWVDAPIEGRLAIMPRPRGGESLADEIIELRRNGITDVLSLLTPDEQKELELSNESEFCATHQITFFNFPILDRGLPTDANSFAPVAKKLSDKIASGGSLAIHCRAGIGRSSVAAAAILAQAGISGERSIELISKARGLSVPDTEEQHRWILNL